MLAAEEGRAALQAMQDEAWRDGARRRVKGIKRGLRTTANALLTPRPEGYDPEEFRKHRELQMWAGTRLDDLDDANRARVMGALHPTLGPTLDRWWIDARAQPYGAGWTRRGFRAPNAPGMTVERRVDQLVRVVDGAGPYAQPPEWFAAWAPFLGLADPSGPHAMEVGPVLAAAIDAGGATGEATFRTLVDSANGDHAVGGMGRHVIVGLLRAGREDGWEFIESMLLAAQRQEGLRQSILEAADEAHPEAFSRIIDLCLRENLIRFAATIRAVSVWLGFPEDAEHIDDAENRLRMLHAFRSDLERTSARVLEGDPWDTYAGLCAVAQFDVGPALGLTSEALRLDDPGSRAAALRFLSNSQLGSETTYPVFAAMTADDDLGVACIAHRCLGWVAPAEQHPGLYESLDALARRLPEKATTAPPLGVDPGRVSIDRGEVVATMVRIVGNRPLEPLLDFLPSMDTYTRSAFVTVIGGRERLDGDLRAAVVRMVGDKSSSVRQSAVSAAGALVPEPSETAALEALLTRKAGDLRRGVIGLLSRLGPDEAVASACRLWAGKPPQRDAACELLGGIERTELVVATARVFLDDNPSAPQRDAMEAIVSDEDTGADDPALGLYSPGDLTPPRPPSPPSRGRRFTDAAAFAIVEALDDLADSHRDTAFALVNWQGSTEVLLADARWLPSPFNPTPPEAEEGAWGMVLPDVFRTWWDDRPNACRGESDGLDALRAIVAVDLCADWETVTYLREAQGETRKWLRPLLGDDRLQVRNHVVVRHVLEWVLAENADEEVLSECVAGGAAVFASVPRARVQQLDRLTDDWRSQAQDWRNPVLTLSPWLSLTSSLFRHDPRLLASDRLAEWYGLMRWVDQPIAGARRFRVASSLLYAAHAIGAASDADVLDHFITPEQTGRWGGGRELLEFTRRLRSQVVDRHPTVVPLADLLRDRVVEIERTRGELATTASHLAYRLGSIEGADLTLELLVRLGRSTLVRGYSWTDNEGRASTYSRMLQVSHPGPDDTPEVVAALVDHHGIKDRRLVDLAMFAPQWAPTVESVLGWDGLEDAIWWFHTHTKDDRWSVDEEVRETWAAMSAERTPLAAADLTDGAVDVEWFRRAHERLGTERWAVLHKAAKLASGGSGHRRAQLFAEAMLGEVEEEAVVERLQKKRHQDSVRALGLMPLPSVGADDAALARYQVLREFERGSKKFGQQRQRSEATAVRIAVENLARTTGAADPQRFVWAMEAAEAGALADGPVSVMEDDLTVTLSVDAEGMPAIDVVRGDKKLKAVPAKLRKHPPIKALTDQRTALKRQASRVRRSLEDAMVRQDAFVDDDFVALDRHPVVAPMLELALWADETDAVAVRRGGRWVDAAGKQCAVKGSVRLAHPVDLLGTGNWIDWQERFFDEAERQPFKQAFRELYVLTDAEAADSPVSRRWSGHQLQTRQASALFTTRGWLSDRDAGQVAKVFHHAGLVARVTFVDGWGTPAEVELPTIESVSFTKRGEYLAQPLDAVPPVVFSETMRDLDLVVSVAHAGGVDPEASASTVEMRAALVRETARLMSLDNVRQESSHVVIDGSLGEYSVHLGSGSVHRRPGGSICIIPVDAQRRGRIFLPFADDDPRTAEVVSKVLLLARDSTIKDPTILEQLRS